LTNNKKHDIIIIESKEREVMIMAREEMMDKVINALGFEDERTVTFCRLAESTMTDDELLAVLKVLLED
jgi:hypothetical protein